MPAIYIPGTDKVIFTNPHNGDLVVDLQNYPDIDDAQRFEDVVVIGDWVDYFDSGTIGPQQAMGQGIQDIDPNKVEAQLWGTEIARTDRGKRQSTHRQRSRLVYIENQKENEKRC